MPPIVSNKNRNGFSLIELMIATTILTIATLGLLSALAQYTRINMDNAMRNEAMRIVEERMELLRGLQFDDTNDFLKPDDGLNPMTTLPMTVTRNIRMISVPYAVRTIISILSYRQDGSTPNSKGVRVLVTWTNQGTTHWHSAATVITREW